MNTTEQAYRLWDGHGGWVEVPAGTMVECNQVGHHYSPHKITGVCGVGHVVSPVRYCAICGEREGSDYAKHCCTDDQMIQD